MKKQIKIGVIGLDSTHCVEYARLLHDPRHDNHVPGARMVAAFPGGSADWALSASRVVDLRNQMVRELSVPVVASIEEVAAAADAIMILSVDGRIHQHQFEAVAGFGKPVYVDKPFSASFAGAQHMHKTALRTGTRLFSASAWRFSRGLAEARAALGRRKTCRHAHLHGPWPLETGLHGWYYYGVHQVEMLFAAMGAGCQRVACARHGRTEVITGFWADGRIGTIATNHEEARPFGGWLLGGNRTVLIKVKDAMHDRYQALLQAVLAFFRGESAPVPLAETIETIAFLEAASRSALRFGAIVELDSLR